MRLGKERKYHHCWLVLRLPFPARADDHQHYGRDSQAAGRKRGHPRLPYLREAFQEGKAEFGGRGLRLTGLIRMLRIDIALLLRVCFHLC